MGLRVVGGPADGLEIASASGSRRWIDPVLARGFSSPGPRRELYLQTGDGYVFVGHERWVCSCNALVLRRMDQCPLCGSERVIGRG